MSLRIKARAIRRAGELLKQIAPAKNQHDASARAGTLPSRKDTAEHAGLSTHQAKQALRVANVPTETFEAEVEGGKPATVTRLVSLVEQRNSVILRENAIVGASRHGEVYEALQIDIGGNCRR